MKNDEAVRMLARLAAHREGTRLMLRSLQAVLLSIEPKPQAQTFAAQLRPVLKMWRGELLSLPQVGMTDEQQQIASETLRAETSAIAAQLEAVLDEFDVQDDAAP
jgi:hypothetical protein